MRDAERAGSSLLTLRRLPAAYRVLYTAVFCFFTLGHAVGLLQQQIRVGLTPRGAAEWVLGNEDDPDATRLLFPRDGAAVLDDAWRRGLADVIPTIVVLALLFRSAWPGGARATLGTALCAAALLDMTGPALVLALGSALGWVWWGAQLVLAGGVAMAAALCIAEMWRFRAAGSRFHARVPARP
jgi:hypothetical protein